MATMFFAMTLPVLNEPFVQSLPAEAYFRLVVSGILGITIADTMFAAALNRLGASLQALADCIYSPAIAGIGFLMFEEYLGMWELLGGILVVGGVAVGMRMTAEVHSRKDLVMGVILASGAHIIMAVGILMVRDLIREESLSIVWISGGSLLCCDGHPCRTGSFSGCLPGRYSWDLPVATPGKPPFP